MNDPSMSDQQPPQTPSLWTEEGQAQRPAPIRMPTTSATAIVGLVLAALSFISCPIVLSIVALVLAHNAAKEIKESNGWVTGEGLVTATRVLAWINIALYGLFVLIIGAIMLFALIASALSS